MMTLRCSMVVTLALGGCATTTATTTTTTTTTATATAPTDVATATKTPAAAGNILTALQNGDRACYVVIETDAGQQSLEGDFDLCEGGENDATALIGQRVTWTTEKARVQAASCQGDPECSDSDEVELVVSLQPAP